MNPGWPGGRGRPGRLGGLQGTAGTCGHLRALAKLSASGRRAWEGRKVMIPWCPPSVPPGRSEDCLPVRGLWCPVRAGGHAGTPGRRPAQGLRLPVESGPQPSLAKAALGGWDLLLPLPLNTQEEEDTTGGGGPCLLFGGHRHRLWGRCGGAGREGEARSWAREKPCLALDVVMHRPRVAARAGRVGRLRGGCAGWALLWGQALGGRAGGDSARSGRRGHLWVLRSQGWRSPGAGTVGGATAGPARK